MSDLEPISFGPGELARPAGLAALSGMRAPVVTFTRRELNEILSVYGRHVAEGEWRDYAIDMMRDKAVFSIFRRTAEAPLYRIEKNPKLARRQGAFSVIATTGLILKRGHELCRVLRIFDKSRLELVKA